MTMKSESKEITLTIPNQIELLPVVLQIASEISKLMGFPRSEQNKIELGLEEAVGNIIRYAFDEGVLDSIKVNFKISALGLGISIFEKGMPFDPGLIKEFSVSKFRTDFSDEGLGIYLMKKFMDEYEFVNHGKAGKETKLFKYLGYRNIEKVLDNNALLEAKEERKAESLPKGSVEYEIRKLNPEEAVEVSRCAYTSYGYTYVNDFVYYPDRVREMNNNGDLISFVAVTKENEIIAHAALEREDDRLVPQIGVAATKPKYRGQGCLNKLAYAMIDDAFDQKFMGVFARGITTHIYSQKSLIKFELLPCALLLSSGVEREYKGIDQGKVQRESVVLFFRYMNPEKDLILYLPENHEQMIKNIYGFIHGSPQISLTDKNLQLPDHESEMHVKTNAINLTSDIFVNNYGKDILTVVHDRLSMQCHDRFETIYLHLKLADPFTAIMCSEFEKMGFFFAGIMPGSNHGDTLILQYLNNHVIDFDYIALACDDAQQILEYIKKNSVKS